MMTVDTARAACADRAPRLFFPEPATTKDAYRPAQSICAACPVKRACRLEALEAEGRKGLAYRHGMYGGWTPSVRVRIAERVYGPVDRECVQGDMFDMEEEL